MPPALPKSLLRNPGKKENTLSLSFNPATITPLPPATEHPRATSHVQPPDCKYHLSLPLLTTFTAIMVTPHDCQRV